MSHTSCKVPDVFSRRGVLGVLLAAGAAGVVYRSARTVSQARSIVPLGTSVDSPLLPPTVTAVVPARNEARVVGDCLSALSAQTHGERGESALRTVLVDDGSTDATGDIAREHAAADPRLSVVRSEGPPPGWSGKVHAMYQGVQAAGEPEPGEWLLFVDADTVLAPSMVARLIRTAEELDADLLSTPGGPQPGHSASWPLLMAPGLQMIGENANPDGSGRKAFAIGHCLLVRRSHYEKVGGWEALASQRNEDVAIATAVRDQGGRVRVVDSRGQVTTSGMDPFSAGWGSFRKSFTAGTGGSLPALVGIGVGQIAASLVSPAALAVGWRRRQPAVAAAGALGWAAQSYAHAKAARIVRANRAVAPAAPLTGALFGGVLLDGAVRVAAGRTTWKDRGTDC